MPKSIDFGRLQSALLESILNGLDAQRIVDSAHVVLQLPIIVFDVEFRPLAFAFERPFYYAPWEEIARGDGTSQFLEFLPNQERIFRHGKSLYFGGGYDDRQPVSEVACAIQAGDKLMGYVGIVQEDAACDDVLHANDLLAKTLSYYYEYSTSRSQSIADLDDEQLYTLLFAKDGFKELCARIYASYRPSYVFAAMQSDDNSIADLEYIRSILCRPENNAMGYVGRCGSLNMLFYGQKAGNIDWICNTLSNIGNDMHVRSGVSDCFLDLQHIRLHLNQATEALRAGTRNIPGCRVYEFKRMLYAIICTEARDRYGDDVLLSPAIQQLMKYEESALYLDTLECYAANHGSSAKTARQLGIHANTLKYRLEKIEAITGMQLKKPVALMNFRTGIAIYRMFTGDAKEAVQTP